MYECARLYYVRSITYLSGPTGVDYGLSKRSLWQRDNRLFYVEIVASCWKMFTMLFKSFSEIVLCLAGSHIVTFAKGSGSLQRGRDPTQEAQPRQEEPAAHMAYSGRFGALLLSPEALSSDEKDRVRGILGLPCLTGVVNIYPDYNRSPTEMFTIFSESLFMSGDLNGLSLDWNLVPQT